MFWLQDTPGVLEFVGFLWIIWLMARVRLWYQRHSCPVCILSSTFLCVDKLRSPSLGLC